MTFFFCGTEQKIFRRMVNIGHSDLQYMDKEIIYHKLYIHKVYIQNVLKLKCYIITWVVYLFKNTLKTVILRNKYNCNILIRIHFIPSEYINYIQMTYERDAFCRHIQSLHLPSRAYWTILDQPYFDPFVQANIQANGSELNQNCD